MKTLKKLLTALLLALAGMHSVQAQDPAWADGEIRRIDLSNKKITLKHGEIKNLDMPPMTMVFSWQDGALPADLLTALKPGDKLRFQARMVDGKTLLVALQR